MGYFLHRMIILVLIFTIAIPFSMGHKKKHHKEKHRRDRSENESDWDDDSPSESDSGNDSEIGRYLKDLCSDTKKSKQCWKIIKPEIARFTDTDIKNVAGVVADLAIAKSREIHDKLNQFYHDSGDDALKEKYKSCLTNYSNANRYLLIARRNLNSDDFGGIHDKVDNAVEELKSCKHDFGEKSFDPAHIRDRNKEFENYVEIVRVATNRFVRSNRDSKA